jgi:hypothetical protein
MIEIIQFWRSSQNYYMLKGSFDMELYHRVLIAKLNQKCSDIK